MGRASGTEWQRAARLDADWVVAALREQARVDLAVEGPCRGGQVGAAYVRWRDGRRSVLTWQPGLSAEAMGSCQLAVLGALRGVGYPGPVVELAVDVRRPGGDTAVVIVQELLPGAPPERVTDELLDDLIRLNDVQAHVLAGRADIPHVRLYLRDDGPGFCLHEPLRRHSPRGAALERWVRSVADACAGDALPGDDAVHMDFHPGNLLTEGARVTGVVDWDGAGRGDRRLDLVTLRFGLCPDLAGTDVIERLDRVLDSMPSEVLLPAWAHMALRMVDWAIRHYPPADVDRWFDLAEQRRG